MVEEARRSDWSGELLDAESVTEVTVVLADGTRRRLCISVREREALRAAGSDATGRLSWFFAEARRHRWRALVWLVTLVVAALVTAFIGQRIANHYANRQQAMDLKASLATTISRAAVRAYDDAFELVDLEVEGHGRGFALQRRRNSVSSAWATAEADVDPLMFVHFRGTTAQRHWQGYRVAIANLIELAYVDEQSVRAVAVGRIRRYLALHPLPPDANEISSAQWARLGCHTVRCSQTKRWRADYRMLGLDLLTERATLTSDLLDAAARNLG